MKNNYSFSLKIFIRNVHLISFKELRQVLISPWICKTLHLEAIYRFTRTHPFPTPDSLSRTLSLHSVLVEGTQLVGKVPSQCQRQSVQHDERREWIEQDHCIFQKWQSWKRDRARADRCTHWTKGGANLQRSTMTLAKLWLHPISHSCLDPQDSSFLYQHA